MASYQQSLAVASSTIIPSLVKALPFAYFCLRSLPRSFARITIDHHRPSKLASIYNQYQYQNLPPTSFVSSFQHSTRKFITTTSTNNKNTPADTSSVVQVVPPIFHNHHLSNNNKSPSISSISSFSTTFTSLQMSQYWNREDSVPRAANLPNNSGTSSTSTITNTVRKAAKIICISDPNDDANAILHAENSLPDGAMVIARGITPDDFDYDALRQVNANVIFVSHPKARETLARILKEVPSVEWVQARSAGIDFITSPTLSASSNVLVTNAKGCFSSTLAEYTMMACSYFAKDLPRLLKQKNEKLWGKYSVEEIRGKTMGIVGYGDIGRACAKLAKAYGMNIIALRRDPTRSKDDPYIDTIMKNDTESLHSLMSQSDYVLISAPLTENTKGLIDAKSLACMKSNSVLINVGRGPIIDEEELIRCLKEKRIKGAALDVFAIEPLPQESEMWNLDNVLMSPHNMDQTETFLHEASEFFVKENLPRFLHGEDLLNPTDQVAGY